MKSKMDKLEAYDNCHFCNSYSPIIQNGHCVSEINGTCKEKELFSPKKKTIVKRAKQWNMTVADLVALIDLGVRYKC